MGSLKNKIKKIEKDEITKALQECNWIKVRAAKNLGITERMIGYKINKYKIRMEKGDEENSQSHVTDSNNQTCSISE